jgi:lysophospholipase L1-like esterase
MTVGFPSYEPYAKSLASTLAATGISVEIVGCGLCGLTAIEMARGLDTQLRDNFDRVGPGLRKLLAEERPFDLVLIMAGTNDLGVPQSSCEEIVEAIASMHRACWAAGTPTLALSVPESLVTGTAQYPECNQKWYAVNNCLADWVCAAQGENPCNRPFFVNTADLVAFNPDACAQGLWDPDNLHFTAAGSKQFGTKLAPMIASDLPIDGRPPARNAAAPILLGRVTSSDSGYQEPTAEKVIWMPTVKDVVRDKDMSVRVVASSVTSSKDSSGPWYSTAPLQGTREAVVSSAAARKNHLSGMQTYAPRASCASPVRYRPLWERQRVAVY